MANIIIFLFSIVMMLIGEMFTVSTLDTHNWLSLYLGVMFAVIGVTMSIYEMGLADNEVRVSRNDML